MLKYDRKKDGKEKSKDGINQNQVGILTAELNEATCGSS